MKTPVERTVADTLDVLDSSSLDEVHARLVPVSQIVLDEMSRALLRTLEPQMPAVQVKGRVKRLPSLREKLHRRFHPSELRDPLPALRQLPDFMALRVICPFLEGVDQAARAAETLYPVLEIDLKGDDRPFSEFGYSSTHLALAISSAHEERFPILAGFRIELQIRTILQEAWAEVEHELIYKVGAHPLNHQIRRKLAALNATLVLSDTIFQEIRDYQNASAADLDRAREAFLRASDTDRTSSVDENSTGISPRVSQIDIEKLLKKGLRAQIAREFEDSIRIYTELSELPLDNFTLAVVLNHRGMAHEALNHHREASVDFARARDMDPRNVRVRVNLGLALRRLGRLDEAENELREALTIKVNSAHAHYALARVLDDRNDHDGACTACRRAVKLGNGFAHAERFLEELEARGPRSRATH